MEAKVVPVDDAVAAAAASGAGGAGPQKPEPKRRRRKGLFFCCKHAAVPHLGKIRAGVLKAVSYAKFKLTPEELLMVWEAAEHSPSLERLDLTGNDLEPVFFDAVSVLQRNSRLAELVLDIWTLPVQALKGALGQDPAIELLPTNPGAVAKMGPAPVRASCAARLAAALLQHNDQSETVRLNNRPLPLQDLRGKSGAVALSFARQGIDHEDMAVIAKLLSSNVALTAVDFSGNPLSPAMADSIADILGSNKSLAAMNLSSVQLCGANSAEPDLSLLRVLCAALQTNHTLHAIGLGRNGLCWGEAAKASRDLTALRLLCDSLMENHGVVELDLHGNSLGDDGVELAATLVSQRTRTRALDVRANEMTAHGAVVFAEALERNVHLRTLSGVPVYDMRNASLTELNLSGTEARQLHVGDAFLLAAALKENPGPITSIDLRGNNLADESMRLVGGALLGHAAGVCKVRFLKCENWSIDPELPKAQARLQRKKPGQFPVGLALDTKGQKLALGEATMLAGVLKQNRTLTFLRLMGTSMGLEAKAVLGNALLDNQDSKITHIECDGFQVHRKSTWMDLERKELKPEDVVLLCGVLSSNKIVSMLNLNGNNVGAVGAKALTKALRSNSAVTDLHIDRCMLGEAGALQLQHLFKPHTAKDLSHAEQMLVRMRSREQQSVQKRAAAEKERAAVKIQENAVVAIRVAAEQLISDSKAEKLQLAPVYEEAMAYAARLQEEEDEQTALLIRNQLMRERVTHESKAGECMTRITELNGIIANTREAMKQHKANERHATKAKEASDDVVTKAKKTLQDVEAERKRFEVKVTDCTAIARAEEATMNLTSLSMVGNEFGERGLRSLGNAILCRCASKLHCLIMDGWSIVPDTLELNLSGMDVGVTDTMLIAGILKANRIVTSLNLQGSHMNDACKEAIGQAIMRNAHSKIESMACDAWSMADELIVDLSKLALNSADVVLLAAAVKHNTRLTTLLMPDDYVGDDAGGLALVDALRVNRTVTRLGDMRPDEMSEADFSDHAYTLLRVFEKQFFVRRLEFCTCLSSLILAHNDMGASEMIPLSEALKLNSSITHLDISGNDLRDYGAKLFADVLRVSPSIGTLVMKDINVGVEGREALGRSLLDTDTSPMRGLVCDQWSVLHDLESLDLSNEGLAASHVYLLGAVLSRSCSVKEVVLAHNDLCPRVEMDDRVAGGHRFDNSGFGLFCEGLAKNKSVTKLDLCKTHLPTSAIRQLGAALCVNSTLQDVDLRFNFITEDGSRILGEALQVNTSINVLGVGMIARSTNVTSLDLSGNHMHPEGTSAVALALQTNRSLHTLVLRDNTLGVDQLNNTEMSGIKAFAKSIGHHPTVTALDLHGNYLRGIYPELQISGLAELTHSIDTNHMLTALDLSFNQLGPEGAQLLSDVVSHTRTISTLDVCNNDFGADGARHFAAGLAENRSLTNLDMSHNRLTGEHPFDDVGGVIAIAESLGTRHCALAFLNLSYNRIANEKSTAGCVALGGVIATNCTLERVLLNTLPLFVQELRGTDGVTSVDFSGKNVGLDDLSVIACLISGNPILKSIDLRFNPQINSTQGAGALGNALMNNRRARVEFIFMDRYEVSPTTVTLALVNASLSPNDMVLLGAVLKWNDTLKELVLKDNLICGVAACTIEGHDLQGLKQLCVGLAANHSIQVLDLSNNAIMHEGGKLIAEMLLQNNTLHTVFLARNGLCREGYSSHCRQIVDTLRYNKQITHLDLHDNDVQPDVIERLAAILPHSNTLANLDIRDNDISRDAGTAFGHALDHNFSLKSLGMGTSTLDLVALKEDKLTELNLGQSYLGPGGVIILCQLLQFSENLALLDLSENGMGLAGGKAVGELMSANEGIHKYNLQGNGLCGIEYDFANSKWKGRYDTSVIDKFCGVIQRSKADRTVDVRNNSIKPALAKHLFKHFGKSFLYQN